jgi:hypothetical protein
MKKKVYCGTCKNKEIKSYGISGYCDHPSAEIFVDTPWERKLEKEMCSIKNSKNNCSFYEEQKKKKSLYK